MLIRNIKIKSCLTRIIHRLVIMRNKNSIKSGTYGIFNPQQ